MAEIFSEVLKTLLEQYVEWAKAPGEAAELVRDLGGHGERVLYQGYARYWNSQKFLDRPLGVILVTEERFVFLAKQKIPFITGTRSLIFPIKTLDHIQCDKYRLGHIINFFVGERKFTFMLANLHTFVSTAHYETVTKIMIEAKRNAS
jgi:hypothetical protein